MTHPYLTGVTGPRILAHRGFVPPALAAEGVAENTRDAFVAALEAGAGFIESDCHLTSDGVVVLFHDRDLGRVTGDARRLSAVTHRELASIMGDRGGLLTLEDALEMFPEVRFNIDVKAAAAAERAGRLAAPHAERVLLTSFSDETRLRALRAASGIGGSLHATSPGRSGIIRLLTALTVRSRRRISAALEGIEALQIPIRQGPLPVLTPRLVSEAHRHGVEVHIWTVNDPERMRALIGLGVDGIVTDRADLAVATLGEPDGK